MATTTTGVPQSSRAALSVLSPPLAASSLCWSLSAQLACEALSTLLKVPIQSAHLTQYSTKSPIQWALTPRTEEFLGADGPMLYFCVSSSQVLLVNLEAIEEQMTKDTDRDINAPILTTSGTAGGPIQSESPLPLVLAFPLGVITQVVVDSEQEDSLGLFLSDSRGHGVPPELWFSTIHRKTLIEHLEICYNTFFGCAPLAAQAVQGANPTVPKTLSIRFTTSAAKFRHPTEQYYRRLPPFLLHNRSLFYRCGYYFLAPINLVDKYALVHNRPCSTYYYHNNSEEELLSSQSLRRAKHLVVRFLPEKNISPYWSVPACRDVRGALVTPQSRHEGVATLEAMSHGRDSNSDLDFQLWTECVARAIAMAESDRAGSKDYFVPEAGVYRKKMNVVGDRASWVCFRMHIFTKCREIGVVSARRRFLPPLHDTYQDMLFVLYGTWNLKLVTDPNFMNELDFLVDSLSPAVAPVPYAFFARNPESELVHPTYCDEWVLQARANALLYNHQQYQWLNTRSWIMNTDGGTGIHPRTSFIDMECHQLAQNFCASILAKISPSVPRVDQIAHDSEHKYDPPVAGPSHTVDDPLSIIFRMQAEMYQEDVVGSYRSTTDASAYSSEEEWKCRVALYFAYCVDGGLFPGRLSLKRLIGAVTHANAEMASLSQEATENLDRVIDFLLYLKPRKDPMNTAAAHAQAVQANGNEKLADASVDDNGFHRQENGVNGSISPSHPTIISPRPGGPKTGPYDFYSSPNILHKLRDPELIKNFTCNEHVLIRILESNYIEFLERQSKPMGGGQSYAAFDERHDSHTEQNQYPSLVALLAKLLSSAKDYNLDMTRAVCAKIVSGHINDPALVPPLIALIKESNMYAKLYAFHALVAMAPRNKQVIFESGGVGLAMWHVYVSKSEEILETAIELCIETFTPQSFGLFSRQDFSKQLIQLLRTRYGGRRYQSTLLARTSSLILKLCSSIDIVTQFVDQQCHVQLMEIIAQHDQYHDIALQLTAALGTIYMNASERQMLTVAVTRGAADSSLLVSILKTYIRPDDLQLCLNILIVLRKLLKSATGVADKTFPERVRVLQSLQDKDGLENVLEKWQHLANGELSHASEQLRLFQSDRTLRAIHSEDLFVAKQKIATGVLKKLRWFKKRLARGIAAAWNIQTLQKQGNFI